MKGITYRAMIDTTRFNEQLDSVVFALLSVARKWKIEADSYNAKCDGYDCNDGLGWTPEELCL